MALLREGHWRTACVRLILCVFDVMEDMDLTAVPSFVLCEAAEIQPTVAR